MTAELRKSYFRYLFAFVLISLSAMLGNLLDGIMVGQLVGPDAVAAVGTVMPLTQGYYTLHLLVGGGAGMLVGLAIGKGDRKRADSLFSLATTVLMCVSLVISGVGLCAPDAASFFFCSNPDLFEQAASYLKWVFLAAPAYFALEVLQTFVAVDGRPELVTMAVIVDNVINVAVSVVLIRAFGMGLGGAAIGTAVGHAIACGALVVGHWRKRAGAPRPLLRFVFPRPRAFAALPSLVSQGAPLAIASMCLTTLLFCANRIILGTLGKDGMFIFSVALNVLFVYNLFLSGCCQTLQSLGAIEKGKGETGFGQVVGFSYRLLGAVSAAICVAVWIFPGLIVRMFGGGDHPELVTSTNAALRAFAPSFILFCLIYLHMIVCKLNGRGAVALFISFALSLTVIPVLWLYARFAPAYIWWSYLTAYVVEIALIFIVERLTRKKE